MKKFNKVLICAAAALGFMSNASATVYTENFEGSFPAWESAWLGTNSNVTNYYGVGQGRGNNPDGLWIADGLNNGTNAVISFNAGFGALINSFSIDVTTYDQGSILSIFDMNHNTLYSSLITSFSGAMTDPGSYQTVQVNSGNGISGFSITGNSVEGNTSIDNVVVTTGTNNVPEPGSLALVGLAIAGLGALRGRKTS